METKSRYEVIAELEERKRDLIMDRDSLDRKLKQQERQLVILKRDVEDKEADINEFKESMEQQKNTIDELIKSTDETLQKFMQINRK